MSVVYFARRTDCTGPIKIGISSYLDDRIYQLGIDYRASFTVLASAPGDHLTERNVHLKFAKHRADVDIAKPGAAEWFEPVPELLAFIKKVGASGKIPLSKSEQRQWVFAERYLAGETLQQIADDYGLTRERVRQILRRIGVPSLGLRIEHRRGAHELTDEEIAAAHAYADGVLPKKIEQRFGLSRHQILRAVDRLGFDRNPRGSPFRIGDPQVITARVEELYREGITSAEIAKKLGLCHQTEVYRWLKRAGVTPSRIPRKLAA